MRSHCIDSVEEKQSPVQILPIKSVHVLQYEDSALTGRTLLRPFFICSPTQYTETLLSHRSG